MPRIYCRKNSADTVSEEFRDKSEIVPLNFIVLRYTLSFGELCFTAVLFCSQSLQSLKDILIEFPDTPTSVTCFNTEDFNWSVYK